MEFIVRDKVILFPLLLWERVRVRDHPPFIPPVKGGTISIDTVDALQKRICALS